MEKLNIWVSAARPKTLAAAFIPVLIGASLAWADGTIHPAATATALLCALLIQTGSNYANDYYDYKKGSDTDQRVGFERATAMGLIAPESMLRAAILSMTLAFFGGLYLIWIGGWVIFWIGVLSILFGILYTGGPYPLGYNGMGDLFVFLFFGLVAVTGTYYLNLLQWSPASFWAAIPAGALCVNILVVNNLRDIHEDRLTGKKTLGVLLGETALKIEYLLMILLSYMTLPVLYFYFNFSGAIFLPVLGFPFVIDRIRTVWFHQEKAILNLTLERTAQFLLLFGILFSIGILIELP